MKNGLALVIVLAMVTVVSAEDGKRPPASVWEKAVDPVWQLVGEDEQRRGVKEALDEIKQQLGPEFSIEGRLGDKTMHVPTRPAPGKKQLEKPTPRDGVHEIPAVWNVELDEKTERRNHAERAQHAEHELREDLGRLQREVRLNARHFEELAAEAEFHGHYPMADHLREIAARQWRLAREMMPIPTDRRRENRPFPSY